jgi:N-methylhydantoinase A
VNVGIDTGGTFTDVVIASELAHSGIVSLKVPSSRDAPGGPIMSAFKEAEVNGADIALFTHGTTVGTNALIERTGCRVGFLTTAGFEDTPFIQRINRATLYDLSWKKPAALVASRRVCLGLSERVGPHGEVVRPLDEEEVRARCHHLRTAGVEAVAVSLLFSYVNMTHEQRVKEIVHEELPNVPVSVSHEVAPIWREYERSSTTIADAYLKPLMERYVRDLDGALAKAGLGHPWAIMKSNGGVMLSTAAAEFPVQTIMSGPAGGMIAAEHVSGACGATDVITLDMGGTSADVGLLIGGRQLHTIEYEIEWGLPAAVPIIDIQSIGAGGGSVAWVDRGGMLRVGPRSSGASPGPACYGRGGLEPTVTDANLVLGRLDEGYFLDGKMFLERGQAEQALRQISDPLAMDVLEAAASIVEIANENMASAIKKVTLERGHDPRRFSLLAFGGAGPLHAAAVGMSLNVTQVIVPPLPGVFSALGLLLADLRVDKVWTQAVKSTDADASEISRRFDAITRLALAELREEGFEGDVAVRRSVTARYLGQNYEHEVALGEGAISEQTLADTFRAFASVHHERYGYEIEDEVIELISFRVTAVGQRPRISLDQVDAGRPRATASREVFFRGYGWVLAEIWHRSTLAPGQELIGPAVVEEAGSTTLVGPGMILRSSQSGTLDIRFGEAKEA